MIANPNRARPNYIYGVQFFHLPTTLWEGQRRTVDACPRWVQWRTGSLPECCSLGFMVIPWKIYLTPTAKGRRRGGPRGPRNTPLNFFHLPTSLWEGLQGTVDTSGRPRSPLCFADPALRSRRAILNKENTRASRTMTRLTVMSILRTPDLL